MTRSKPSVWIPALVSLALSLSCLGDRVFWQDSGYYLTAVKEFTALYPPGFVLYLLLCKAWTLLFGFLDFARAVHLFSAACAAGAAAALGAATSAWLRTRDGRLKVLDGPADAGLEELGGACAGSLAATGFTFWFSGLYAKGYSLLYLVLALLLWRMIVAAERRRPRDFTVVAVLIGLAWQAHPSATGAGLALIAFVAAHAGVLGWKGVAGRTALAGAAALGPSLLLLPWLTSGDAEIAFGEPRSLGELLRYVSGAAYTSGEGVFGWQGSRWTLAARFFWEELLGVGLGLLGWGAFRAAKAAPRVLAAALLWAGLYTALPTLFILEGQQDLWYVAAWMPLHLVVGLGVRELANRAGAKAAVAVVALGGAWAVAANRADLDQRGYDAAEIFGRVQLEPLSPRAILLATSDDTVAIGHYLRIVRGARPDVVIVRGSRLQDGEGGPGWYERRLLRRDPTLKAPDYAGTRARFPEASKELVSLAAFANANVAADRAVYFEKLPPVKMLREDFVIVPAGPLVKLVPRGQEALDARAWSFPIEPERVRTLYRRERGQWLDEAAGMVTREEPYEHRLVRLLARARFLLAEWHFRKKSMEPARELLESMLRVYPEAGLLDEVVYPLAVATSVTGPKARARDLFEVLVARAADPFVRSRSWLNLGDLKAAEGDGPGARACWTRALDGADPALRAEVEKRLARP